MGLCPVLAVSYLVRNEEQGIAGPNFLLPPQTGPHNKLCCATQTLREGKSYGYDNVG
jgi:hypothetical protein